MARLNEAPCASESIDALKRRFIRQNRELAKNNSAQSVRIRCLEAEISRLLTDNLQLRDEILQLRNDLEGVPSKRLLGVVKDQLEAQVQVLAQLVAGIGISREKKEKKNEALSLRLPTVGWGRGLSDPLDGTDGRLPAIMEDKSYPRQTLNAEEIQALAEGSADSPALGSPPVSYFRDEEPIKFENLSTVEPKKENEDLDSFPPHLETRRKKKDGNTKIAIRRMSVFSPSEEEAKNGEESKVRVMQTAPTRTGAKRKLALRDDDGNPTEEFTFCRKPNNTSNSADELREKDSSAEPLTDGLKSDLGRPALAKLAERKALGERNVNTDPVVSPKKTVKNPTILEEKEALKKMVEQAKQKQRTSRDRKSRVATTMPVTTASQNTASQAAQVSEVSPPEESIKMDLPPKTPATVGDMFSAPSTEDSTRTQGGRDTPPPSDLSASTDATGRPGRRARAHVNYAEPSLAAKMRRPTKELLDAVGKDGRPLSGMIVKKDPVGLKTEGSEGVGSVWKTMPSASMIKSERGEGRVEPGSPLSKKSTTSREPMKAVAETEPTQPSAASQAIAALIKESRTNAASRRRSTATLQRALDTERCGERKDKGSSSIYDFASSSPQRSSSLAATSSRPNSQASDRNTDTEDNSKSGRTSRRHSSIASLSGAPSKESLTDAAKAPSRFGTGVAAGHKRTVSGTVRTISEVDHAAVDSGTDLRASRRRSMML
ncbi:uncharacterized protein PV09_03795 [Verruconis gallopava]|uniref:Shugoshin C-terminal domain-containing protein n=1 Tax=Verruconis gallopava TaxID=253628 RepID=A0A0D2AE50_9PEZI|nr:uncharacterized protein PV09_03795 [Verruconis gallopava]KIW05263.1 hypothetical protein PV09_03795 [Verruconis gallopava]